MNVTINGKSINLGEWAIDILGTFAVFWIASRFFMESEVAVADQPTAFAVCLGIAFVGFKALRQWKALN
ncbi:MAG: hypothetical protein AAFY24_01930 [Pseudomonadota bacterium]